MVNDSLIIKLESIIENEMRSCSMDICGSTPLYVYRMLGEQVSLNEIEVALKFQDPRFMIQDGRFAQNLKKI